MSRVAIFISLLCIGACARTGAKEPPLPETIAGGWHRGPIQKQPLEAAPKLARGAGVRSWWRADYTGAGVVHLQIFEVASGAAGLDLVQKWRPAADAVTFYTERYFTVVKWDGGDREELRALIGRLQRMLVGSRREFD